MDLVRGLKPVPFPWVPLIRLAGDYEAVEMAQNGMTEELSWLGD